MIDRIYITNFRRIEEADIELRDGLTCLTGQNGTGKSSIIEAMEFCLYGRTKSGTTKETIRRHGAVDREVVYVAVDFSMGDLHYRCSRYLTRALSPRATLYAYTAGEYGRLRELDEDPKRDRRTLDKSLGTPVATGAKGVTETISEMFGIDYDGFKASFVARQKELDSLAASLTPEARKKFFNTLLGHERLDEIRPEINRELRATKATIDALERQGVSIKETEKEIRAERKALSDVERRVSKGIRTVDRQERVCAELASQCNELSGLSREVSMARQSLERDEADLQNHLQKKEELSHLLVEHEKKARGYDPDSQIATVLAAAEQELRLASEYDQKKATRADTEVMLEVAVENLHRLTQQKEELEKVLRAQPDGIAAEERYSKAEANLHAAEATLRGIEEQGHSVKELLDQVEMGETVKCPTCGTDIASESGRSHLSSEYQGLRKRFRAARDKVSDLRNQKEAAETARNATRSLVRTYAAKSSNLNDITREHASQEASVKRQQQDLTAIDKYLSEHASDQRTGVARSRLEERVEELKGQLQHEGEMRAAFMAKSKTAAEIDREQGLIARLQEGIGRNRDIVNRNPNVDRRFQELQEQRGLAEEKAREYRSLLESLRREQGSREASIKALEQKLETAKEQERSLADLRVRQETYTGVRAVVESLRETLPAKIAPALSARASKLLEVATNGMYRMIEIDDSYEVSVYTDDAVQGIAMMSGGEQDIISLCIRIAISEMILSTRALGQQTLVLDEIFGALDDERRSSACSALQNLGTLLPRILCITHIDDIKDMADYTYVVERDEHGVSHVREVENDARNLMPRHPSAETEAA